MPFARALPFAIRFAIVTSRLPKGPGGRHARPVHHCPHSRDGRPAGQPARETDQLAARAPTRTAICRNLRFLRRFDSSTRWLGAKGRTKVWCAQACAVIPGSPPVQGPGAHPLAWIHPDAHVITLTNQRLFICTQRLTSQALPLLSGTPPPCFCTTSFYHGHCNVPVRPTAVLCTAVCEKLL